MYGGNWTAHGTVELFLLHFEQLSAVSVDGNSYQDLAFYRE